MADKSYNLFCPLAMACELVEPRWTLLILAEMWDGSTRFNEIRRGVPGISPSLLSRRLKDLEANGLVERHENPAKGTVDYVRTPKAIELETAMTQLGDWAYRHIQADVALGEPNPDYLMWQMRRTIDPGALPRRRVVVRFYFTDLNPDVATYWMIAKPGTDIDLCMTDPGFDVDVFVEAQVKALASVWMGYSSIRREIAGDRMFVGGDPILTRSVEAWLGKCQYADEAA